MEGEQILSIYGVAVGINDSLGGFKVSPDKIRPSFHRINRTVMSKKGILVT